jgi:hypothetical protein
MESAPFRKKPVPAPLAAMHAPALAPSPPRRHRAAAALAAALLASCSSTAVYTTRVERETLAGPPPAGRASSPVSVDVETRNGAVAVRSDITASEVLVRARLQAGGRDEAAAEERLAAIDFDVRVDEAGTVLVRPVFPGGWRSGDGAGFEVVVPALASAVVDTSNARVELSGARGPSRVETSNGSVRVMDCTGGLEVSTSNGSVSVVRSRGVLDVDTSNASVNVEDHVGDFAGRTSNGPIRCRLAEGAFRARTSNAPIEVELPSSWGGVVEASTSNGGIRVTQPTGAVERHGTRSRFVLGDGSAASRAETSNGSIAVTLR